MVQPICHDVIFLAQKSRDYTPADSQLLTDLTDTLLAHRDSCAGMAANMIGAAVRIIAFFDEGKLTVLCNPTLLSGKGEYTAAEGCLSLSGVRETRRYRTIRLQYETPEGKVRIKTYKGYSAQVVQHELDHTLGILV